VDNAAFTINGNQLQINNSPDFETKASYSILVRSTDQGGLFVDKAVTIAVNNLNEAPVLTTPATINYTDTPFVDSFAVKTGTIVGTDVDAGTTLVYGITGGVAGSIAGTVVASNVYGTLTVKTATGAYSFTPDNAAIEALNTAVPSDTSLSVTVSDGIQTVSKAFTVAIAQSGITESNGNDNLTGTTGNDVINALMGNDTVDGLAGSDVIYGGAGDDRLDGGVSDAYNPGVIDSLNGGAGNDTFLVRGFFGAGVYDGGADTDTLDFSQSDAYTTGRRTGESAGVSVNLASNKASTYYVSASNYTWTDANGQISVTNIENVIGSNQNDLLYGDGNVNSLEGGAGNDLLYGAGGVDVLKGGAGNDTYYVDNVGMLLRKRRVKVGIISIQASATA
jgi:VCBS repeat-containing protein